MFDAFLKEWEGSGEAKEDTILNRSAIKKRWQLKVKIKVYIMLFV